MEHHLSALLQLHLHSRLNMWLQWIGQRNCKMRWEKCKFFYLVCLILEVWQYFEITTDVPYPASPYKLATGYLSWVCLEKIDQFHRSHNAPVPYPTIHHIGTEMCTFLFHCGVLWDMGLVHCGISEADLLTVIALMSGACQPTRDDIATPELSVPICPLCGHTIAYSTLRLRLRQQYGFPEVGW